MESTKPYVKTTLGTHEIQALMFARLIFTQMMQEEISMPPHVVCCCQLICMWGKCQVRDVMNVENMPVTIMVLASKVWRLCVVEGWCSVATVPLLHHSRLSYICQNTNQASEWIAVQQVALTTNLTLSTGTAERLVGVEGGINGVSCKRGRKGPQQRSHHNQHWIHAA